MTIDKWDLTDIDEAYYRHSGNLSIVLRQLIYAEGAIVWILLSFYKLTTLPCSALLFYLSIFVFFLVDLVQYWYMTAAYGKTSDDMVATKKASILKSKAEPRFQEFIPNTKKFVAIISSIFFVIFLYNTIPMREILSSCLL
jgi:hypothetical protein